jgi:hypothetical protein
MQPVPLTPELRAAAPAVGTSLGALIAGLIALIARAFLRNPRRVAIILPLCTRLNRAGQRFNRVMARLAAGTRVRPSRARDRRGGAPPAPLPTQCGWLLADLRHEAAYFHHRLDALLAEPETAAILAACPQAARILRPICRMLGLRPAALPPLPRRPRKPRRKPRRPPAPAPVAEPELIPLAATRRLRRGPDGLYLPPCPHVGWPWFPHPANRYG